MNMEVRITGVMLASILAELASPARHSGGLEGSGDAVGIGRAQEDVVGLLYGTVVQRNSTTSIDDSSDARGLSLKTQFVIKSYSKVMDAEFCDGTGKVNRMAVLVNKTPHAQRGLHLLGWFKARSHTQTRPSCKELAVTRSMASHVECPQPLFALFTASYPNNIKSFDYRFFFGAAGPAPAPNPPVTMDFFVTNLVSSSQAEYQEFDVLWVAAEQKDNEHSTPNKGPSLLPSSPTPRSPSSSPSSHPVSATTAALETAHANALKGLHELARQIKAVDEECAEVEREIMSMTRIPASPFALTTSTSNTI